MKFTDLWKNHPTVESIVDDAPCKHNGKKAFENQCAIRMGESIRKSGANLTSFKGAKCWYKHSQLHILRAEELATWLKSPHSPLKQCIEFEGVNGFNQIQGKKGVIFFKDYYGPGKQGDHIDLWNGSRLTKYSSWFEFAFRNGRHYSDATVWFWPVN